MLDEDLEPLQTERSQLIQFQSLSFDLNFSRTVPNLVLNSNALKQYSGFLKFLSTMDENKLLDSSTLTGNVVFADDQFVNIQNVKRHFKDLGISDKLITCSDGQYVLEYFDELLSTYEQEEGTRDNSNNNPK